MICIIRVSESWRRHSASPGQHNGNHLHKENGGHPFPVPMQGEPSVVVSSHQEKHHHSPPSVAIHIGKHRGGLPQQTQTAEVGLQTDLIRVLEDLPQTLSLAHFGCLHVKRESSYPQVHDLGKRPQGNGNQSPGLVMEPRNLAILPGPPHSYSTGGGSRTED